MDRWPVSFSFWFGFLRYGMPWLWGLHIGETVMGPRNCIALGFPIAVLVQKEKYYLFLIKIT